MTDSAFAFSPIPLAVSAEDTRAHGSRRHRAGSDEIAAMAVNARGASTLHIETYPEQESQARVHGALAKYIALATGISLIWLTAIGGRTHLVRMAPPLAGLYSAIGLPVNLLELDFRNVKSQLIVDNGQKLLVVEGEILNRATVARPMPRLRLSVLNGEGQQIYVWTANPPKARLERGESTPFRARLASPPSEGVEIAARFVTSENENDKRRNGL